MAILAQACALALGHSTDGSDEQWAVELAVEWWRPAAFAAHGGGLRRDRVRRGPRVSAAFADPAAALAVLQGAART